MSQARRTQDAPKQRKNILRKMKTLAKLVAAHGQRYYDLLDEQWENTSWSRPQAECVLERIENVLAKLPRAIKQAHERIIGERRVPSRDKLLSLYEEDIHVIVRGKANAEVEFGNPLNCRGYEHREKALAWSVLAHNLWTLGTMARKARREKEAALLDKAA